MTDTLENHDPMTGVPEFHPVGTGVGAASGGAAGALAGTAMGGPVGGVIGAAIGVIAGGLAGKGVAEHFDPTGEDLYWSKNYPTRPYADGSKNFDTYRPAYALGYETRRRRLGSTFDELEADFERGWESFKDKSELTWEQAKGAVRDGWDRVENSFTGLFDDEDEYWRGNYSTRPYVRDGEPFETYEPAYRYGYRTRLERIEDGWDAVENDLEAGWDRVKGATRLTWAEAKEAVRDGWHHVERAIPGDFDRDGR